MINFMWLFLIASGIIYAGLQGNIGTVAVSAISGAEAAVMLAFKLMGVMCLWLGMMKIAEKAGMIHFFAVVLGPLVRALFPGIPNKHPAMGAIIMTLSANMLGLGNAVTPLGIKAMQELQKLNGNRKTASANMCTLLALCTAGFTLIPATIIALRAAAGSVNPGEIIGATLIVSFSATLTVVIADRIFRLFYNLRERR
ncbi:putative membrane protein [Propionispora sp. 2/2-37]|uniref:nucleoside recognition domain-containing protein n=1 Tax=Propionispora sp. 2/2-37 TaxID=1677858 RepID=UPI0006BB9369|nr:nucleoside recognition domain-containing protein [Propionispora sp. 2/2-37]CUH94074.1 putative membrane protein [Propionispora sp. 2/2-37]